MSCWWHRTCGCAIHFLTIFDEVLMDRREFLAATIFVLLLNGCTSEKSTMDKDKLTEFATRYATAWGSQDAASVAAHFSEHGSLKINEDAPAVGRAAITAAAQSFMTAFPDMAVSMDSLEVKGNHAIFRWTLTGTNTGPGGAGKAVRVSGYEEWTIGVDGLIERSLGHFDAAEYQRQLQHGAPTSAK
jgi:SnoaL-like protein